MSPHDDSASFGDSAGADTTYDGADLEALAVLDNYTAWIVDHFRPYLGGDMVEFGAGTGNLSERLRPFARTLDLVEPSVNLIDPLRRRFAEADNVTVRHETLEADIVGRADASRDAVAMVNVLEHIADDAGTVAECHRILRPGGHLLIFVPALRQLFSDMDRLVGHLRRYHRPELRRVAEDAGFEVVNLRYFDFVGTFAWWLINGVMGKTAFDPRLAGLYDRAFVPVMRPVERLIPPPFGKNLVLIARRPEAGA